jgi:hypothetical protein
MNGSFGSSAFSEDWLKLVVSSLPPTSVVLPISVTIEDSEVAPSLDDSSVEESVTDWLDSELCDDKLASVLSVTPELSLLPPVVTSTLSVLSEVSPLDVVVSTLSVLSVVPVLAELSVLIGVSVVSVGSVFDVSSTSDVVLKSEELTILELSVVRSDDFVAKSDESVVRPDDGLVSPEDSDTASEDTLVTSDDPLVRSRDPVVTSEDPVVRSDDGVVNPEESVAASEDSLVKAEESVIFDDSVDMSVACSELISELLLLSVLSLVLSWPLTVVSRSLVCALPRLYAVSTSIGVSVSSAEIVKSPEPSTVLSITEVPLLGTLVSSWSPEPVIPVPSLATGDAGASLSIKSSMERSVSFDHPGTVDSVLAPNLSSP